MNDRSVPPGDGADPPGTEPSRADDPRHENVGGVFDELANAFASARESVAALLELLLLELRRASLSLVWMLVCALLAAVCFVAVWIGLSAALALWMIADGIDPLLAVLSVTGINLLAALGFIGVCVLMSRNLQFSATRRQLSLDVRARSEADT